MAEEYAQDYEVAELPQVVFMAMLLNDVMKLGVLSRRMNRLSKSCGVMLFRHGLGIIGVGS